MLFRLIVCTTLCAALCTAMCMGAAEASRIAAATERPAGPAMRQPVLLAQADSDAKPSVDAPLPTILRSESDMPEPVRETRRKLIEAAKTGDIESLRALMAAEEKPPAVALGDPGDPIEYLKALSADADGREILAILWEVLDAGFVHVAADAPNAGEEVYVWPYFAEYPPEALTPEQQVELFRLLTAADYEDMKSYGTYTFFRVGIAPDGRWLFFLAGD
jgi:hypothetical protein